MASNHYVSPNVDDRRDNHHEMSPVDNSPLLFTDGDNLAMHINLSDGVFVEHQPTYST